MAQTLKEKYERKSQEQQNLNEAFDAKAVQAASSIIKRIANSFKGVQGFDNLIKAKNNIIDKVTDVLTEEEGTGIINKLVKVIKKDDDKDKLPIYMAMSFGASINSFFMLLEEFLRARGDAKGIEVELFKLENDLEDKKVTDLVEANKIAAIVKKGLSPGGQFSKYDWASYGGTSYADIAKDLEAATLGQIADIAKKTKAAFANQGQAIKQVGQALAQGPSGGGGKEASGGGGGKADEAQEATQDILEIDFGGLKTLKTLQNKIKQNPERAEKWIVEFREKLVELFKFLLSKRDQQDIGDKKVSEIFAESSLRFRHLSLLLEEAGQISDKLKQALGGFGGYADDLINDIKDMKYSEIITIATKALADLGENAGAAPSAPKEDKSADEKQAGADKGTATGSEKKGDTSDKSTGQSAAETGKKSKTPSVAKEKLLGLSIFADKKDEITKLLGDEKNADALGKALFVISNHILKGRVQYKNDLSESLRSRYQKLLTEADRERSKVQLSGYIKKLPQELKNILTPIFIGKNAGDLQKVAKEILGSLGDSAAAGVDTANAEVQADKGEKTEDKNKPSFQYAKALVELHTDIYNKIVELKENQQSDQKVEDIADVVIKQMLNDEFFTNLAQEWLTNARLKTAEFADEMLDKYYENASHLEAAKKFQEISPNDTHIVTSKITKKFQEFIRIADQKDKTIDVPTSDLPSIPPAEGSKSPQEAAPPDEKSKILDLEIFDDQQKDALKKALGNDPKKSKKLEDILGQIYDFIAGDRVKYNDSGITESLRSRYLRLLREADETKVTLSQFIDSIDDESIKGVLKKIFVGKKKDELVGLVNKVAGRLGKPEISSPGVESGANMQQASPAASSTPKQKDKKGEQQENIEKINKEAKEKLNDILRYLLEYYYPKSENFLGDDEIIEINDFLRSWEKNDDAHGFKTTFEKIIKAYEVFGEDKEKKLDGFYEELKKEIYDVKDELPDYVNAVENLISKYFNKSLEKPVEKSSSEEGKKEPPKEGGENKKQEIDKVKSELKDLTDLYLKNGKLESNKMVTAFAELRKLDGKEYDQYLTNLADEIDKMRASGKIDDNKAQSFRKTFSDFSAESYKKLQKSGFVRGGRLLREYSGTKQFPSPSKKVAGGGKTGQQSAGDKDDKNDVLKQFKAVVSKIPPKGDFISKVKKSGANPQDLQVLVKKLKIDDLNTLIKLLNIQKPNPQQ